MSRMTIRSSYAIDAATDQRIKRLAAVWGVSQAEVIRRSVQRVAETNEGVAYSPADVVAHYRNNVLPRSAEETRTLIESLRKLRHDADAARARARSA
ncbi:MAG: hypothetical protein JSR34_02030 [Proteobacteria bacterium]|nr:hypothetical protein [Pseudomonadota bacterium]